MTLISLTLLEGYEVTLNDLKRKFYVLTHRVRTDTHLRIYNDADPALARLCVGELFQTKYPCVDYDGALWVPYQERSAWYIQDSGLDRTYYYFVYRRVRLDEI